VRTLVLGVSTRAAVESAVRGGHEVVAVDFFGDRDQAGLAESYALRRDLGLPATAEGLEAAAGRLRADAVVYGSSLENHPEVVARLAGRRRVLGNSAEALREVRDWAVLRRFCREAGIAHPVTLLRGEERGAGRGRWLRKRVRSGGGHGIAPWDGSALDDAHVLQAVVEGAPASVAFVADGARSRVFAVTEQLLGIAALGASGFSWCGNILPPEVDGGVAGGASLYGELDAMAAALTRRFGLVGVNGLDVVIGRDAEGAPRAYLIEVNPRFSGSMELAEWSSGVNVFSLHLDSFAGRLPETAVAAPAGRDTLGKAIVYARRALVVPDADDWPGSAARDLPWPGERIERGHPVCTVVARGRDRRDCFGGLLAAAGEVYGDNDEWKEGSREPASHPDHRSHAQAGDRHAQGQELARVP